MRARRSILATASATAVLIGVSIPAQSVADEEPVPARDAPVDAIDEDGVDVESETGRWIIRLDDKPLASYRGEVSGLSATSPEVTGDDQLDPTTAASIAYLDHLARERNAVVAAIEDTLGREVEVIHEYRATLNGMAIEVRADEAAVVSELDDVAAVEPDDVRELDTDVSNDLISSPAIWEGETASNVGTRGEGVVVGMIDSGVNPDHPSFAATDGAGYTHTNPFGAGTYVGVCDPEHPHHDPMCNDKLIGAWDFASIVADARDGEGHGSHTGATMAGNTHDAVVTVGDHEYVRTVSGVAPRANVISYKACGFFGCFSSDSVAAIDQAILDGVDVLNYSISGGDRPWNDAVDLAFLEAYEAGIFIAASAGNDGPGHGTVAKTAPWNASVAATTHERVIANAVDVIGPEPVPEKLTGMAGVLGDGSPFPESVEAPIRFAGPVDAEDQGCEPFEDGTFDGAVALIMRGGCNFSDKIDNASDAGAAGVVVVNQFAGPPVVMSGLENTAVPGLMVSNGDGLALRDYIVASDVPITARLGVESTLALNDDWADIVADFSARGPSQYDLLAPTFAAPGRNILAAGAADGDDPTQYEFMQGTSMSSPHAAGAGALLAALHPDWSPAAIRSALATSADRDGLVKEDGTTPADPFDVGSGRLDLAEASRTGVVFDETHDKFAAADPADGGDPRTLNVPSLVDQTCDQSCTWTRTVTSVADTPVTYTAAGVAPDGMSVTVNPSTFTVQPGDTQAIDITMDVSGETGVWIFGSIELTTDTPHPGDGPPVSDAHLPIAAFQPEPEIAVDPSALESLQDVAQQVPQAVTITNSGGKALEWELDTAGEDCDLPTWASVSPASGTVDPHAESVVEVTFDSTDMTAGDYAGTVCIASNDPNTPIVTVDLALTVVEIPAADVTDSRIAKTQPADITTAGSFAVANDGYGTLNWTLNDEDAGPSEERVQLLRDGVLIAPNSFFGEVRVMAFDKHNGDLIDDEFMAYPEFAPPSMIYTPVKLLPKLDGTGFLIVDQFQSAITEYDLSGEYLGVFAPIGGSDRDVMSNIRSLAWSPDDTLLVTVSSGGNADSVVEFDTDGTFLGQYVPAGLDGLDSPWGLLIRDNDILVSDITTDAIHSFSLDGTTANERFAEGLAWPQQMVELDNGNVLTVNSRSGTGSAVHEYDAAGNEVGRYEAAGSSYDGVHPLGNGNIIVSTSTGVYEIDRDGQVAKTFDGGTVRSFTEVQLPDAQTCSTPDEVPWLTVSSSDGAVDSGSADEVTVTLDSTGLTAGDYTAQLCVTSDDPDLPLVTVPVQMTVTDAVCTDTVADAHHGPLRATSGLLCLGHGSSVSGPVAVTGGASVFADGATLNGPVSIEGAETVAVHMTMVNGPVSVTGSAGPLTVAGNYVRGPVRLAGNDAGEDPIVVAGNTVSGPLSCSRNAPPPVNNGDANEVAGPRSGQCADL